MIPSQAENTISKTEWKSYYHPLKNPIYNNILQKSSNKKEFLKKILFNRKKDRISTYIIYFAITRFCISFLAEFVAFSCDV